MKLKNILSILILMMAVFANAQVGIGTTSPNANLDIRSSNQAAPANNDGVLVPKVDAFPATNPTALQNGMLVFLTTASGANAPGFYYWNNATTAWIGLTTATSGWSLTGNAGTSSATNFLGTTDPTDIVFKRNNVRAGFIGDPNTATGNKNTSFGANSLNSVTTGIRNTAVGTNTLQANSTGSTNVGIGDQVLFLNDIGTSNTAVGVGSLYSNTSGNSNTGIGRNALTANATASFNTAVGRDALPSNTDGAQNTATGVNALFSNVSGGFNTANGVQALRSNTNGTNNTAVGYQSLFSNLLGTNNVALGNQAGYYSTGSNSVFLGNKAGFGVANTGSNNVYIGNQAGSNETTSNKLYIENSTADASNALIYGDFGSSPKVLRTNSQFQIGDGGTTGYKFPVGRGTNKQIMETDASGSLSWVNGPNTNSIMRSKLSSNQALGTGGWQKVNFNTTVFDTNSEFNGAGTFTAAKAGYFRIDAGIHTLSQADSQFYSIGIYVNGTLYQETTSNHFGNGPVCRNINCIVSLAIGNTVEVYVQNYQLSVNVDSYLTKSFFEVQQIR